MNNSEKNETKYYDLEAIQVARNQVQHPHPENTKSVIQFYQAQSSVMKEVHNAICSKVQKSVDNTNQE